MSDGFAFIGAALAVMFLFMIGFTVWHCGFDTHCYQRDIDCYTGWCHR